jgi:hypothetical protein
MIELPLTGWVVPMFKSLILNTALASSLFVEYLKHMPVLKDLSCNFEGSRSSADCSYALKKVSELVDQ